MNKPEDDDTPFLDEIIYALLNNSKLVSVGDYEVTNTDKFLEDLEDG